MTNNRDLPPDVQNQREDIYDRMCDAMNSIHARRRLLKKVMIGTTASLIVLAVGTLAYFMNPAPDRVVEQDRQGTTETLEKVEHRLVSLELISDDELLAILEKNGQPSILALVGGEVRVVSLDSFPEQ